MRCSRVDRAVIAAVSEMAACGASTRKAERIAARMGMDRMSPSRASRICEAPDATIADLRNAIRPMMRFPASGSMRPMSGAAMKAMRRHARR